MRDDKGRTLANVRIQLQSKGGFPYYAGTTGAFGIPLAIAQDTISLFLDGFEPFKQQIQASKFQTLVMKPKTNNSTVTQGLLISLTKNISKNDRQLYYHSDETYNSLVENDFIESRKYAETGFALNIDKASYSNTRRFLNMGLKVPPDAVRIEEMLNYFNFYNADSISTGTAFNFNTSITSTPWKSDHQLLFVNLQAPKLNVQSIPPTNLIFLLDVSGSMDKENRLPMLQLAFKSLTKNLREQDSVAIVTYGGKVGVLLPPTSGKDKAGICNAIDQLKADGDTPGEAGIRTAYTLAEKSFNKKANNRIILATDGDFNVGQTSDKELEELIVSHRESGIYLTCLGVGMGNYKDSKLEALAKKGNGNFAYIDHLQEAEKVLVKEFTTTMYAVANDAYLAIKFNPSIVKQYRLIGFDNRKTALDDSSSILQGGEVGSGHSLFAVFEIIPTPDFAVNPGALNTNASVATLQLQYNLPGNNSSRIQSFDVPYNYRDIKTADAGLRFATSVTMFGELVKQSRFAADYTWKDVETLATAAVNTADPSQTEFLSLIAKAQKIYSEKKKKGEE